MDKLLEILEAIVFAAGKGIAIKDILEKMPHVTEQEVRSVLDDDLKKKYSGSSGIRLIFYKDKVQFQSNPKYGDIVTDILTPIKEKELSKTLLEVLAIVAYKQPVTRLDIEEIRGVSSEYAVAMLQKVNMIEPVGVKDAIGKPTLFGTTEEFLKKFEIADLNELPLYEDVLARVNEIDKNYNVTTESLYATKSASDSLDVVEQEIVKSIEERLGDKVDESKESAAADNVEHGQSKKAIVADNVEQGKIEEATATDNVTNDQTEKSVIVEQGKIEEVVAADNVEQTQVIKVKVKAKGAKKSDGAARQKLVKKIAATVDDELQQLLEQSEKPEFLLDEKIEVFE